MSAFAEHPETWKLGDLRALVRDFAAEPDDKFVPIVFEEDDDD